MLHKTNFAHLYSVAAHGFLGDILQLMVGYYGQEVQVFHSVSYKLEYDQTLLAYYFSLLSTCGQCNSQILLVIHLNLRKENFQPIFTLRYFLNPLF